MSNIVSREAEEALLGALLLENKAIDQVVSLDGKEFSTPLHQRIFWAIKDFRSHGRQANPVTISKFFEGDSEFQQLGGIKYLYSLGLNAGLLVSVPDYGRTITDMHRRRELSQICQQAIADLENIDWTKSSSAVGSELMRNTENCLRNIIEADEETCHDVIASILLEMETSRPIYKTGFPLLNEAMGGGIHAGMAYGFAGRKKSGKTILASSISYYLNERDVPHLFVCGEMSPKEVHSRNVCRATGLWPSAIRNATPEALEKIREYQQKSKNNIFYRNAPGLTFSQLQQYVIGAIYNHGIKGFILDYWQLVGGKGRNQSTAEHLESVAQWMADFSRKHGIFALVTAQINQEGNTRGSEGMRLAFDQIYQINRPENDKNGAWLEMMDSRYTAWMNIGSDNNCEFILDGHGPYFKAR